MLWESSKNQFGRPKKKKKGRQNFGKFFENPPPPRENPRSAPEYTNTPVAQQGGGMGGPPTGVNTVGKLKPQGCVPWENKTAGVLPWEEAKSQGCSKVKENLLEGVSV